MPIRDHESNRQRQPRRFSRKVRKTLQNAYRKYLNDSRAKIREDIRRLMQLNRTIVLKNRKRSNKIGIAAQPCSSYREKNPEFGNIVIIDCHGSHMISKAG